MKKKCILLCFLWVLTVNVECQETLLVDVLRADFLKLEDEMWNYTMNQQNKENGHDDSMDFIINKIQQFDDKNISQLPQDLLYGLDIARQTFPFLTFYADLRVIDDMYEKFRRYRKLHLRLDGRDDAEYVMMEVKTATLKDAILEDEKNSVNKTIQRIYEQIYSYDVKTVYQALIEIVYNDYLCKENSGTTQTPQQVFYNLYNSIATIDLKGYIMVQFALLTSELEEPGRYTKISFEAHRQYRERVKDLISTFQEQMKQQHKKLWKCDPKHHVLGTTYEELTKLLQGHIQNEADLNPSRSCRKTCNDYSSTRNYGCYDGKSEYCRRRKPCNGRLLECKSLNKNINVCISPSDSMRRYEYIENKDSTVFGHKTKCNKPEAKSWIRWFVRCSYCMCICDEEGRSSDRYFNLRPVMADVENNRVVTGVRFVKHNRIIHLQIQEGKLLPYGYIDSSTVRWVPVDNYQITDIATVREGRDYFKMKFERRSMNMDDLASHESDKIITGVNFVNIADRLLLQINVRRFDFTNGTLSEDNHFIFGSNAYRTKINMEAPDIPTRTSTTKPNFDVDKYVVFTHTDIIKDVAQTTVPFIDIQPVYSNPAVPLKGLGIYYKGETGYGGFIAPIITTYDFGKIITDNPNKLF